MIVLAYPIMLLLIFIPFIVHYMLPPVKGMHGDALRVPFLDDIAKISILSGVLWRKNSRISCSKVLWWTLYVAWCLLCLAITRPQLVGEPIRNNNYGHDILLVTDISVSMLEPDFSYKGRRLDRLTILLNNVRMTA